MNAYWGWISEWLVANSGDVVHTAEKLVVGITLTLGLGVGLARFGPRTSAARRHLLWSALCGGILIAPVLQRIVPHYYVVRVSPTPERAPAALLAPPTSMAAAIPSVPQGPSRPALTAPSGGGQAPSVLPTVSPVTRSSWVTVVGVIFTLWALGTLFVLVVLVRSYRRAQKFVAESSPLLDPRISAIAEASAAAIGLRRPVMLRVHPAAVPMVCGIVQPAIVLSPQSLAWSDTQVRQVLLHEMAHVFRRDTLTQAIASLAVAVYWFHPLTWFVARALRRESERACDDVVLLAGEPPATYATNLLDLTMVFTRLPAILPAALPFAGPSQVPGRLRAVLDTAQRRTLVSWREAAVAWGTVVGLVAMGAGGVSAQQATALALRGVTVVDVTDGRQIPDQTVLVVGNRIQAIGPVKTVKVPAGATVVEATGKYLIPGLWDAHVHVGIWPEVLYPLFVANGITGIRDAGSPVALKTVQGWRQEVLAGTRVGPPRQLLSGQSVYGPADGGGCQRATKDDWNTNSDTFVPGVAPGPLYDGPQTCVVNVADGVHYVDSLVDAGVDMIKLRAVNTPALFFAMAAEARRRGIPFGGHVNEGVRDDQNRYTTLEASDSGERIIDHELGVKGCRQPGDSTWDATGPTSPDPAAREQCWKAAAERYRRNDTWLAPTLLTNAGTQDDNGPIYNGRPAIVALNAYLNASGRDFWSGKSLISNWIRLGRKNWGLAPADSFGLLRAAGRYGMPIVAGTDAAGDPKPGYQYNPIVDNAPGFSLHAELTGYVAEGLTPLQALQSATLNPAKMWHATDSLGTVAAGKLADLVLLDGDPLSDISNTTTIHAVIANGRYFDRAALDQLLAQARAARDAGWQRHGWGAAAPMNR